jgi:mannose-6-phosphate isomerase-like protein (cupin superfamily)
MDREEILVVMSGTISATVGGEEVRAQPGDVVIVPAGALLQIRNERDQDAP